MRQQALEVVVCFGGGSKFGRELMIDSQKNIPATANTALNDVEVRRYGGRLQARRCRGIEGWSSGGALQACRRGDVDAWRRRRVETDVWRSEALESCCRCRDVEEFASRALEMRCRRVASKRYGALAYGCCCWNF